jgi:hypothetical protein
MQRACYDVALWVRWSAGLLACSELPRYVEEVEAFSHVDAAQRLMQKYGLLCVAHVAVGCQGVVKRWSFLRVSEDGEDV